MKYLIIVDVQNDFVDGALGTAEAQAMLPELLKKAENFQGTIILTKDTHTEDYLNTQEGRLLPVPHCIRGMEGWEFPEPVAKLAATRNARVYEKPCFGSMELARDLAEAGDAESVELVGLCTDICVISNALLIKAALPEVPVSADARCCAGVTPEKHKAALEVMRSCQVLVEG
ncbi:MAG: cysteine hydrolase [Eubacteriales bacterium]|nr:cysteine hydrolase [Eubacteriales bacterium]